MVVVNLPVTPFARTRYALSAKSKRLVETIKKDSDRVLNDHCMYTTATTITAAPLHVRVIIPSGMKPVVFTVEGQGYCHPGPSGIAEG